MTEPMSHEDLSELVAAYALDAVETDEARMIEEHLGVCPRCRAELAEHREVTALLAHTGAPAPEGLWDRIVAALDEPPAPVELGDVLPLRRPAPTGRRPGPRWMVAAAAAAAVVGLLGVQVARQNQQIDDLRAHVERADPAFQNPDATLVELASPNGEVRVQALVDRDGRGILRAHGLPALTAGETYQLWGVVDDGQPVSLGVLGRDPTATGFHVSGDVRALAITAEEAPGVVVSEEDPVVAGELA